MTDEKVVVGSFLLVYICFSCCQNRNGVALPASTVQGPVVDGHSIKSLRHIVDSLYEADKYAAAIAYFDSLLKIDSLDGELYFERGYSYDQVYKQVELPQAIRDYRRAIELNYDKATSYYNLGLCYVIANDSVALACFENSLKADPTYKESLIQIAFLKKRLAAAKELHR